VDLNRLSPGLLHAFLVVAEVGKISEAARQLHLSQPAVTAQIRRLEADPGHATVHSVCPGCDFDAPWNSFTRTASARFRRPGRGISPKFRSHTDGISVIYEVHVRCCHSTVSPVPPSLRTFHFGVNRKITPMTSRRLPPCPVRGLHYLKDVGLNRLQQV
jgi:pullulanase/glycogen debranching enzyme